jgi:MFS family permease
MCLTDLRNILGPLLGAIFAERATWRGLFYFICPICIICAAISQWLLPSNMPTVNYRETIQKIDFLGLITGSAAIVLLLIPISGGGAYFAWASPMVIAMLSIGGMLTVAFVVIEWKIAQLPMFPLYLWKNVPVAALLLQNFLLGIAWYSYIYYLPLYYQNAHGYSPIMSAVLTIPMVVAQSSFSILSGRYISQFKRYGEVIWSGFAIWTRKWWILINHP